MGKKECEKFRKGVYAGITLDRRDSRRYAQRMNPKGYEFIVDKTEPMRIPYR